MHFFENTGPRSLAHLSITPLESVISAWSAGIQIDKDVSRDIPCDLDAGHPYRDDDDLHFHVL
jgi:hypothetical protein